MATGQGSRIYKSIEEYKKDWEEIEVVKEAKREYAMTITYTPEGVPSMTHKNNGVREGDVIACLEIAKLQFITEISGGGKK